MNPLHRSFLEKAAAVNVNRIAFTHKLQKQAFWGAAVAKFGVPAAGKAAPAVLSSAAKPAAGSVAQQAFGVASRGAMRGAARAPVASAVPGAPPVSTWGKIKDWGGAALNHGSSLAMLYSLFQGNQPAEQSGAAQPQQAGDAGGFEYPSTPQNFSRAQLALNSPGRMGQRPSAQVYPGTNTPRLQTYGARF